MINDHFTNNQALNLLWVNQKDTKVNLELTKEELSHLQLIVIDEWDTLDSPYKKELVSKDKLIILSLMTKQEPIFK